MHSIAAQLQTTRMALASVAGDQAGLEARLLAAQAWAMTPELLVKHADEPRDAAALDALLARRLQHEPIAQIVGKKPFWRDEFHVSPAVLTPRADSETMIETLLQLCPDTQAPLRILDLGTGSGCLLLSALREYPKAEGVAVDQSVAALAIATRNAQNLELDTRCTMLQGNWCETLQGTFDVILSNPPYIPTVEIATLDADVRLHEPHAALDGGTNGLDCYREILAQVKPHLVPNGWLLFEVGMGQAADVSALGEAQGFRTHTITHDLAGIARLVVLQPHSTHA